MSEKGGGGGHHSLEKTFAMLLAGLIGFAWATAALQTLVAMVTPTVRAITSWLEAHGVLIAVVAIVVVSGYVWLRLKLARLGARAPRRWAGEQQSQPVYAYDPRRDRPGLLGGIGRWLAFRSGGPVIIQGGVPMGRASGFDSEAADLDDEDEAEDGDASPSDGEASEDEKVPGHPVDEAEQRRYTRAQARRIFSQAMRPRHR